MATHYFPAPEVKEVAEALIPVHHSHLVDARVDYLFCDKVTRKGGKEVWGTMRKVTNLTAYFGAADNEKENGVNDPFFVMVISKPVWDGLGEEKRKALVDHELMHAWVELDDEGEPKLSIRPHDLEEFTDIVKRYGVWRTDVKKFVDCANGKFDDEDESESS